MSGLAAPFDVDQVRARIQANVPELRLVGLAADYASVRSLSDFTPPCAYVLLAKDKGIDTRSGAALRNQQTRMAQVMSVNFGIVLVVRNYRESAGGQVKDELVSMLGKIRGLILGWTPDTNGGRPCQIVAGDLTQYDNATALWTDLWQTQRIIQTEVTP